ncbi:MAG: hypothetical protein VST68_01305 [Nitrospirota bacterium]|nr:hypothetical protein [Nitrospirota bacterium]
MEKAERNWMIWGAVGIAVLSSLILIVPGKNPLVPIPFYLLLLAWLIGYGFIAALPLIYLVEFWFLRRKECFGKFTLNSALLFLVFNILYFWVAWENGIKWWGKLHTQLVAIENAIGFFILIILAHHGEKWNSRSIQYSANLFMFLLLAWCAFPILGEIP